MSHFGCPICRSFALVYPTALEDDQPVLCASCGAFVSTYAELKQRAERTANSNLPRSRLSGC
jgi:hypothetical protein